MHTHNTRIGIVGMGFVGQVIHRFYPHAKIYDIRPGAWDSLEEVLAQDYIFVAANFQDNCAGEENRAALNRYFEATMPGKVIIIKSTFTPGTTDYFQLRHPHLIFSYNPEFLTEATAWEDFAQPTFQILGTTEKSREIADALFAILPEAPTKSVITARDAEVLKHSLNTFFAAKVIFFNQMYDTCRMLGANYEAIREIMAQHPWVGNSHSVIWHKGYRGFGGKCLPKDVQALAKAAPLPLWKTLLEINGTLTATHNAEPTLPRIPALKNLLKRIATKR